MGVYAREIALFESKLPSLLAEHRGKWIIIKGEEISGPYPDAEAAYLAAAEKHGRDSEFLMREITDRRPRLISPFVSAPR